ncbi:MAG: hypothetical protein MJB14_00990 [Spirochaetes bacterium]|nr:hypothetical protein [Spirochaetota bacterium]
MKILKEFDLDIPNINDKNKRSKFRYEVRCIASLYERFFEKFKTENCWKILIDCVDKVNNKIVRDFLGVYTIEVEFNIDAYFKASNHEKKKNILETLKKGIDIIVKEKDWPIEPFNKAYKKVIENNYINNWIWKKPVKNTKNDYIASVFCEHELDEFNIFMIINSIKGEEILKRKIITVQPDEFIYSNYLGEFKWLSINQVALIDKNKKKYIVDLTSINLKKM